jgi:signal transduction histidine kinase
VHDLNNWLSIVQVNLELLDREISDEDQRALIKDAHDATELCNELIKGLFAERSGQVTRPLPLDINEELAAIGNLIQKRLGPEIQVEQDLAKGLGTISADPTLLRNACLNLVANARDAMTSGGRLFITTSKVKIDASTALNHINAKPGAYVMLSVRDTGSGIPPVTLRRALEPYFTTKSPGRSLGLGLTLVCEFCEQFEGFIRLESKVGKGTTVSIYLPRHDDRQAVS